MQYLRNKHAELADRLAMETRAAKTGSAILWTGTRLVRIAGGDGILQRAIERARRSLGASRIRSYPTADDHA